MSAKLEGFKSGTGIVHMAQDVRSKQAYVLAVLTDLEANEHYTIHYKAGDIANDCSNMIGVRRAEADDSTTVLMDVTTDHTGMAVRPWEQLVVDIYGSESPLNKMLLLLKKNTNEVVDCGLFRTVGNFTDFARQANGATGRHGGSDAFGYALMTTVLTAVVTLLLR